MCLYWSKKNRENLDRSCWIRKKDMKILKYFFRDNLQPKMSFEERILTLPETGAAIQTLMDEMCWPGDVFSKGQEISKKFGVFKSSKKQTKYV